MGLFDKFKKKKTDEKIKPGEKQEAQTAQKPEPAEQEGCANASRRFTFLAEDTFQLEGDNGVVAVGAVHGAMQVKDAVYVISPEGKILLTSVDDMERMTDGQMRKLAEAADTTVGVRLTDIKDRSLIPKFSVLTNIRPQPTVDVNTAVENPYLLGLSCEYERFQADREFFNILINEVVHGHYLVPVFLGKEPEPDGKGKAVFTEGTTMSLPSLSHPSETDKNVFPVFTDWTELNRWTNLFDEQHPPKVMIFSFPDCGSFAVKGNSGMVINPFGPHPVFLSDQLVEAIKNSERYQREFAENAGDQVRQIKVEKETKVTLGVPRETNEVRLIRGAIADYGKKNEEVEAAYLLLKIDESGERVYFCVVDGPKEEIHKIYGEIYHEVKPYANEIPVFEFAGRADISNLDSCLTGDALVYQKTEH